MQLMQAQAAAMNHRPKPSRRRPLLPLRSPKTGRRYSGVPWVFGSLSHIAFLPCSTYDAHTFPFCFMDMTTPPGETSTKPSFVKQLGVLFVVLLLVGFIFTSMKWQEAEKRLLLVQQNQPGTRSQNQEAAKRIVEPGAKTLLASRGHAAHRGHDR